MSDIDKVRFALEVVQGGEGVLLDLSSGAICRLNATAAFIWTHAMSGTASADIAQRLQERFGIPGPIARQDVNATLVLPPVNTRPVGVGDNLCYKWTGGAYRLSTESRALLELSADGAAIRKLAPLAAHELVAYSRALSPKLAALRGTCLLHAAAVRAAPGGIIAFLGESGAGKTTTARTFAEAGYNLQCEDKLVLRFEDSQPIAVPDGEHKLETVLRELHGRLMKCGLSEWCNVDSSIDRISTGQGEPLLQIVLLDSKRRRGSHLRLTRVLPGEAAAMVFTNSFLGSSDPREWRPRLHQAALLARTTPIYQATMPDGLAFVREEARRYTEITAS